MEKSVKIIGQKVLYVLMVFLFAGCAFNQEIYLPEQYEVKNKQIQKERKQVATKQIPKPAIVAISKTDWANYYYGVLPCANCSGVETWLHLKKTAHQASYELSENYLQMENGVFATTGTLIWQTNVIAKLQAKDEDRYIFVGKNSVTLMNTPDESLQNSYMLKKLDAFVENGKQLLVLPKSVQKGKIDNQKAIKFNALMNVNEPTHKSLKASYVMECQKDTYTVVKSVLFEGEFATLKEKNMLENKVMSFKGENDVLWQARKKYCK